MLEQFFETFAIAPVSRPRTGTLTPAIDVKETDKDVVISAELPGLHEKDLEVALHKDHLTIRGEKKHEREEKRGEIYYSERSYGTFTRTVPLPDDVDPNQVDATFKNGVLSVKLLKTQPALPESKKIEVRSEK